jgi:hypothetical protein
VYETKWRQDCLSDEHVQVLIVLGLFGVLDGAGRCLALLRSIMPPILISSCEKARNLKPRGKHDELVNCAGVARGLDDQREQGELETRLRMRGRADKVLQLIGTKFMNRNRVEVA